MPTTFSAILPQLDKIQWDQLTQTDPIQFTQLMEWWNSLSEKEKEVEASALEQHILAQSSNNKSLWFGWAVALGMHHRILSLCEDEEIDINYSDASGRTPFFVACQNGHKEVVAQLLADPRIDVTTTSNEGTTPFYVACGNGRKEVVAQLLADPRIDVNKPANNGTSPFYSACAGNHKEAVEKLLADPRVEVNKPAYNGTTPFYTACGMGHEEIVRLLLAHTRVKPNLPSTNGSIPLAIACVKGHYPVVLRLMYQDGFDFKQVQNNLDLILACTPEVIAAVLLASSHLSPETFDLFKGKQADPDEEQHKERAQTLLDKVEKPQEEFIAHITTDYANTHRAFRSLRKELVAPAVFAQIIFLCDGLLKTKGKEAAAHFFHIAQQLPIELQMTLCHRLVGSPGHVITSAQSEAAFKDLARHYLSL